MCIRDRPKDEYVYLLGMAISVFIYNNGFIIENIINTDKSYSWYDLIDKESGRLNSPKMCIRDRLGPLKSL